MMMMMTNSFGSSAQHRAHWEWLFWPMCSCILGVAKRCLQLLLVANRRCSTRDFSNCWLCRNSMPSTVCSAVVRASVCLSVRLIRRLLRVCCWGPGMAGGQQQPRPGTARSSKCGECHVVGWHGKLNTDLFVEMECWRRVRFLVN